MIVPAHWAEGRARHRAAGRTLTVRRFGWSDVGPAEAQAHADERAADALRRMLAGERLPKREPKVGYNGAEGVPIREEVLRREGNVVITRNGYGAHCLNTPDVLFADVDFRPGAAPGLVVGCAALLLVGALAFARAQGSWWVLLWASILALAAASPLARALRAAWLARVGGVEREALARIARFAARRPAWQLRVYRTPSGFRVLALHRLFDTADPEVAGCFEALGVDPVYARMCQRQRCFRARLTAKPWRIGIAAHMRPRPGVWPVADARRPLRDAWVARYERAAAGHAACRFVVAYGQGTPNPVAAAVQRLHDEACRADSALPVA